MLQADGIIYFVDSMVRAGNALLGVPFASSRVYLSDQRAETMYARFLFLLNRVLSLRINFMRFSKSSFLRKSNQWFVLIFSVLG